MINSGSLHHSVNRPNHWWNSSHLRPVRWPRNDGTTNMRTSETLLLPSWDVVSSTQHSSDSWDNRTIVVRCKRFRFRRREHRNGLLVLHIAIVLQTRSDNLFGFLTFFVRDNDVDRRTICHRLTLLSCSTRTV